jgi:hypothetical protein
MKRPHDCSELKVDPFFLQRFNGCALMVRIRPRTLCRLTKKTFHGLLPYCYPQSFSKINPRF